MTCIVDHRSVRCKMAAALFAFSACLAIADGAVAEESEPPALPSDWSLNVSPYIWGAGLKGSIASFPGAPAADVDVSFNDILKNLDAAGMMIAQLRYQRFAAYMDLIYTSISADQDTPLGILFDDVELENEIFIGTFGGAYRPIETGHASLDLLVGVRVWSVDTVLKLEGGALPDQEFEHDENWVDPIVGFHGHYQFDNGIFLTNLVQVGGFGAGSDLTWDTFGASATSSIGPSRRSQAIGILRSTMSTTASSSTSKCPVP